MNKKQFEELRDKIFEDIKVINKKKGDDYTKGDEDALKNFKEGVMFGLSPMQVCGMFMKKHIDAIYNYIRTGGQSESEPISERIKDAILYMILLQGIIIDEKIEKEAPDLYLMATELRELAPKGWSEQTIVNWMEYYRLTRNNDKTLKNKTILNMFVETELLKK